MDKKTQAAYNNGFGAGTVTTLTYVIGSMDPSPTPEQLDWLHSQREDAIIQEHFDYDDHEYIADLSEHLGLTLSDMLDIVEEGRECHGK